MEWSNWWAGKMVIHSRNPNVIGIRGTRRDKTSEDSGSQTLVDLADQAKEISFSPREQWGALGEILSGMGVA